MAVPEGAVGEKMIVAGAELPHSGPQAERNKQKEKINVQI
jgi:hypothetical protein